MARIFSVPVQPFVPNPTLSSVTPTGGAAQSITYKIVGIGSDGKTTAASAGVTDATGPTTLDATHFETLVWTDPLNAAFVDIYRTAGGTSQGKIGRVAAGVQTFVDDGKVGDAISPPTSNFTGVGTAVVVDWARDKSVQIDGTFVSTNQLQGSIDNVNWQNEGSAATTATVVNISTSWAFIRNKQTAYTSGTVAITFCGHEER